MDGAAQPERPRVVRGGNAELRWEYDEASQVYTKTWAKQYFGTWYDTVRGRTRPVLWVCGPLNDANERIVETRRWTYTDGRED